MMRLLLLCNGMFSFFYYYLLFRINPYILVFFLISNDESCDIGGHTKPLDLESPQFLSDYSELLSMTSSSEMYGIKKYRLSIYYKLLR